MNSNIAAMLERLKGGNPVMEYTFGISMRPLLRQGRDIVLISPVEGREMKPGDILMFLRPGDERFILHRLVALSGDVYVTRGDNCLTSENVRREEIVGVLTEIVKKRSGRHISMASRSMRIYGGFWMAIWPLRRVGMKMRRLGGRMLRKAGLRK